MLERELKDLTRKDSNPQYDIVADWIANCPDEVFLAVVRTPECVLRYFSRSDDVLMDGDFPAYIKAAEAYTDRHKMMLEKDDGYRREFEENKKMFEAFVKGQKNEKTGKNSP